MAWNAVLTEPFVGTDDDPPNPASWGLVENGDADATIQGNRLQFRADGSVGASNAEINSGPATGTIQHVRFECTVTVPQPSGDFFYTLKPRSVDANNEYAVQFQRTGGGTLEVRLNKRLAGTPTALDTQVLNNTDTQWRVRCEILGSTIRYVVREFSLGPIAEGVWDAQVTDTGITTATAPHFNYTANNGFAETIGTLDDVVIYEFVPPPPSWTPACIDEFTGTDNDPPDVGKWSLTTNGAGDATIQGNELEFTADGTGGDATAEIDSTPCTGNLDDARIEFDVQLPATNRFFFNGKIRTVDTNNEYRVQFQRTSVSGNVLVRLNKTVGGSTTFLHTQLNIAGSGASHWQVRAEIEGTTLRYAVRAFTGIPITEGDWDAEIVDTDITTAAPTAWNLTALSGYAAVAVVLDNVVISEFAPPEEGAGSVNLALLGVG